MFLVIWLWCIFPFLAINRIPQTSTLKHKENSPIFEQINEVYDDRSDEDDDNEGKSSIVRPRFPKPIRIPKPAPEEWETPNESKSKLKHKGHDYSKAAELLRSSLNQSVDPCEDFFEFTCGKWLANNPIQKGEKRSSHFGELFNKTKHLLHGLLVNTKPSPSRAINMVKTMFNACMSYNRKKPSALLEKINEFCGWPILRGSDWDPECFNAPHLLAKFRRSLGLGSIFLDLSVDPHRFNTSQQIIYFDQSSLGLWNSAIYRNETKVEEYKERITHMVKVLSSDAGIDFCDEKISHEVNKIVDFEKQLANITTNYNHYRDKLAAFTIRRYSNLTKLFPEIPEYFKALLPIKKSFHDYFASDPEVYVLDGFPEKLSKLLRKTNKTTLVNYVMLRYVMAWSMKHLDDRLEIKKDENTDTQDLKCVQQVVGHMSYAGGAMYVRKYFGNDSKNAVLELVGDVRNAFRKMMGQNTWMDSVTKKRAISKLDKVLPQIGFPEFLLNDTAVDAYYDELIFDDDESYSSMVEKISDFKTAKEFQKLMAPTDRNEFSTPVYVINAFFMSSLNNIRFPAGILQAPFYDKSFPKSMNYGGIGYVIGHEFTHGFDDEVGSKNDETGAEGCWWEPETKTNFIKQKQCLIDEYSRYRLPQVNMTVNGSHTETENIADNGGVKEAYMAYKAYLKKLGHEEARVPGFEQFTNEQLFFISNGLSWCGKMTDDTLKQQLKNDVHSPARYRVNGPLPNLPEFAAAFNCPKGSTMNPEKKCRVW